MNVRKASNLASVVLFGSILLNANADIINDFSNQELLDTQVETAKFQKQETYKENFKKETFKLGQACCFFNGIGKYPHLKIIDPQSDAYKIIKLGFIDPTTGKNKIIENDTELEFLTPLRFTQVFYGPDFGFTVKTDKIYRGERKDYSPVGEKLSHIFKEEKFHGSPFIDEYKAAIPMFWNLRNIEQFRALSTYMLKKFEEEQFVPSTKVLLVLRIENDPTLKNFNSTDKEFIQTYFELFPLTDEDIINFFNTNKRRILEACKDLDHIVNINDTVWQGIYKKFEGSFKAFSGTQYGILVGGLLVADLTKKVLFENVQPWGDNSLIGKSFSGLGKLAKKIFGKDENRHDVGSGPVSTSAQAPDPEPAI